MMYSESLLSGTSYFEMEGAFVEDGGRRKRGETHVKRHISNILHEYEGVSYRSFLATSPHLVYDNISLTF
jgi:hypothetical protein